MADNVNKCFELSNFKNWLIDELTLRESNQNSITEEYRKPLSTWMRFTSNIIYNNFEGFILEDPQTAESRYGLSLGGEGVILGKDVKGNIHRLPNGTNYLYRPSPGVTSITYEQTGENNGLFGTCKVSWKCWSPEQLEYMSNFFMVAGATAVVEWGWNNCPQPPLDLNNISGSGNGLYELWDNYNNIEKRWESCKGRSNFVLGTITNFDFSLNEQGGYDCVVDVVHTGPLASCFSSQQSNAKDKDGQNKITMGDWLNKNLDKLVEDNLDPLPKLDPTLSEESVKWKKQVFSLKRWKNKQSRSMENYEFANSNENKFYIKFNVIVGLINAFFKDKKNNDKDNQIEFFELKTDGVRISASPNIKPTNDYIFLPNAKAPIGRYSNYILKGDPQSNSWKGDASSDFKEANEVLIENGLFSNERVDLHSVLIDGLRSDVDLNDLKINPFPSYYDDDTSSGDPDAQPNFGYFGYLNDIYVEKELVRKTLCSNENMKQGIMQLLEEISGCVNKIWSFDIRSKDQENKNLYIIDRSFKGLTPLSDLKKVQSYTFKYGTRKSIVKSATFTGKLPDSVAIQTISRNYINSNDKSGEANSSRNISGLFTRVDRLLSHRETLATIEAEKNKKQNGDLDSSEKKVDESIKNSLKKEYGLFKKSWEGGDILIRAFEPDSKLLDAILKDGHPQNSAYSNSPIPGVELQFTILGIVGFKTLDCIYFMGIPSFFTKNGLFFVKKTSHEVNENGWYTTISAGLTVGP